MPAHAFEPIPEPRRPAAAAAVAAAFGKRAPERIEPVLGGASGALVYRIDVGGRPYLMRMEPPASPLRDPAQGLACMAIAANAGVAPPLHLCDVETGVSIMDFIVARPLAEHPGGPAGFVEAAAQLAVRLQAGPIFPARPQPYAATIARMLAYLSASVFADGLLARHAAGLARLRDAYPWDAASPVACHNDPNPQNLLYDGERLWLVDWETAGANDPLVDIAILANNHAPTPDLVDALLAAWAGCAADDALTTLYYGCLSLAVTSPPGGPRETDLSALTVEEFRAGYAAGSIKAGAPETLRILGKMQLAGFIAYLDHPAFRAALERARG